MGPSGVYAVSVDTGHTSDIWLLDASGKLTRNLTKGRGDNVSPSWSPDGRYITFVSSRSGTPQVHIMNSDGSGQRRLTMAGAYNSTPDFGPDGKIVFAGLDEGHSDLFTVDLAGNIERLTQGQGSNLDPVWSPDGRWIAYVSTRDGRRIWLMTADGRHQFPLTRSMSCATPTWRR
jgi:TolB protein